MEALIAKADALPPVSKKRKTSHSSLQKKNISDYTAQSISKSTSTPKSLRHPLPLSSASEKNVHTYKHIPNKKLRGELTRQSAHSVRAKALLEDAQEMLAMEEKGGIEVEGEMERTWRIGQSDIVQAVGQEAGRGRREVKLEGGPYRVRYTRNGRHLAIAGRTGHVSTFDCQTGTVHAELQLQETCRDITFLHDQTYFAVAQKKYVYIYDHDGVELHCLKSHIEPTRLEFLPYHWLLASVGNSGYLKYQDTSTGTLLSSHRTKLGSCTTMAQNVHNAVIHLGHQNGCVTLWTPNLPHPAVQILAHLGPVTSVSVDPSEGGRYMATAGRDGTVKVWDCRNWKGAVREWGTRGTGGTELEWSARGFLGVASGGSVNVYQPPTIHTPHLHHSPPPLYLTHPLPSTASRPITSIRFTPFQDALTLGHSSGLSTILVPGSGEPNFDSSEADPFESKKARREREVRALLDKIQPDMIALDPEFVGRLAPESKLTTRAEMLREKNSGGGKGKKEGEVPFARMSRMERLRVAGKMDVSEVVGSDDEGAGGDEGEGEGERRKESKEEREKRKMRGKGKSLKRYLRKQRKNVVDPAALAIRAKLEKQKEEKKRARLAAAAGGAGEPAKKKSALDRFKRST